MSNSFREELSREYNEKQRILEMRKRYEEDEEYRNQLTVEELNQITKSYNEETLEIIRQIETEKRKREKLLAKLN